MPPAGFVILPVDYQQRICSPPLMNPTLFSYCIPYDDGAAPNPFWGVCTLNICKPVIRRVARVGDWVVGTGAKLSASRDLRGTVVYAMRISKTMKMAEYDSSTRSHLPEKRPRWNSKDWRERLGDSIYDFSVKPPKVRTGVHTVKNRKRDLSGECTLLSNYFFYFGDKPVPLPPNLRHIVKDGQGHRSRSNAPFVELFIEWIHNLGVRPNTLVAKPQLDLFKNKELESFCSKGRCLQAEEDEVIGDCD